MAWKVKWGNFSNCSLRADGEEGSTGKQQRDIEVNEDVGGCADPGRDLE